MPEGYTRPIEGQTGSYDYAFFALANSELQEARRRWRPINSAHEGYAVIREELEEFWAEVKRKPAERNAGDMYAELVQIAAMACRCAVDVALHYDPASHDDT